MKFIKKLDEMLEKKGITAYKLSQETGISQATISSWRKGSKPNIDAVVKIIEYLEEDANEMLEIHTRKTENEKELLKYFNVLPDREQIKAIGRMEDKAREFAEQGKSSTSKTG